MYKKYFRIVSLIMVLLFVFGTIAYAAEPMSSAYIISDGAKIIRQSDGSLKIEFNVTGKGTMTKIGAEEIRLYTSDQVLVKTFNYTDDEYENMMGGNTARYSSYITYPGDPNLQYYVVVTFYAGNSTGYGTVKYTSYIY